MPSRAFVSAAAGCCCAIRFTPPATSPASRVRSAARSARDIRYVGLINKSFSSNSGKGLTPTHYAGWRTGVSPRLGRGLLDDALDATVGMFGESHRGSTVD